MKILRPLFSLFFVVFYFSHSFAQTNDVVFSDDFNDNNNSWKINNDTNCVRSIKNGVYKIQNNKGIRKTYFHYFIDDQKDFSYEVTMRQIAGKLKEYYGFAFGIAKYEDHGFRFYISSDNTFSIKEVNESGTKDIVKWKHAPIIRDYSEPNILKVEKSGNKWNFYINEELVYSMKAQKLYGCRFAFITSDLVGIEVDKMIVRNIQPPIKQVEQWKTGGQKENLGDAINTVYEEKLPVISADGKLIYFTRDNHPDNTGVEKNDDVWFSFSADDGKWSVPQKLNFPINTDRNNAVISVMPDGNTLWLSGKYNTDGTGGEGISMSHKSKEGWSFPSEVKIKNYSNKSAFISECFSPNGKVLISGMQRDDSFGEMDLYVSFLQKDGTWSEPKNCGSSINTRYDDGTPFIAADGKTIYFSTDGRRGYGDRDIFMTKRLDDSWTKWSEPLNLGPEINSADFDAYFSLPASGDYAYMVSYSNSFGSSDIFKYKMPEQLRPEPVNLISGVVLDSISKKPVSAKIIYEDLNTHEEIGIARSDAQSGSYKITLNKGQMIGFRAEAEGYYSVSDFIETHQLNIYNELQRNLFLIPIKVGSTIPLQNIFFEQSKEVLLRTSFPELDRLAQFLKTNSNLKIEILGHTDNIGDPQKNMDLSQKRAEVVKKYLTEKGISEGRLSVKGYGGSRPRFDNNSEESRKRNRRVEFLIVN